MFAARQLFLRQAAECIEQQAIVRTNVSVCIEHFIVGLVEKIIAQISLRDVDWRGFSAPVKGGDLCVDGCVGKLVSGTGHWAVSDPTEMAVPTIPDFTFSSSQSDTTEKWVRFATPKEVVSATSEASRPVAINTRPRR